MISLGSLFGGGGGGFDIFGGSGDWSIDTDGMMSGVSGASLGLGALQGFASYQSMQAKIGQTRRNAASAETSYMNQAADEYINAQQARVAGVGQVAGLRTQLANVLGSRTAAAGAAGVDVGQGVAADTRTTITQRAVDSGAMATMNADIAARRHTINALQAIYASNQTAANAQETEEAQRTSGLLGMGLSLAKLFL